MNRYYAYTLGVVGALSLIAGVTNLPKRTQTKPEPFQAACSTVLGNKMFLAEDFTIELKGSAVYIKDANGTENIVDLANCVLIRRAPQ